MFTFVACDPEDNKIPGDVKTSLNTPVNLTIDEEDFTLRWSIVSGASGYSVNIDGIDYETESEEYSLESLISEHKVYQIKVKALAGNNATHSDSAYTAPISCEPAMFIFTYNPSGGSVNILASRNITQSALSLIITGLTNFGRTLIEIVIPELIENMEVTVIGASAFEDSIIESVVIPATIVEVGRNAFRGSSSLREVTFQRGGSGSSDITILDEGVFEGCIVLESIIVPEGSEEAYLEAIIESTPELENQITIELPPLPELTGTVIIEGIVEVDEEIWANIEEISNGEGQVSYQWKRDEIDVGENSMFYIITNMDVGYTITVTVTFSGNSGSLTSDPTIEVPEPDLPHVKFSITLDHITGEVPLSETWFQINIATGTPVTVNLYNSSSYKNESIEWFINGVSKAVGTTSYIVSPSDFAGTDAGLHSLTIEVETLEGDFYNRTFAFQVYNY